MKLLKYLKQKLVKFLDNEFVYFIIGKKHKNHIQK